MPSIEDWLSNPLNIVGEAFENRQNCKEWKQKVEEFFKNKISDEKLCLLIPSLNSTPLHLVPSTSLVRFRCMIQDSFEPEYFLETYEVVNKTTGEKVIGTSCYKDVIDSPDGYDVITESPQNETGCRQVLFCVSIPGETEWVKQFTLPPPPVQGVVNSNVSTKRSHDDEPMEATEETCVDSPNLEVSHPLPWEKGQAAIVKVYDETMDFKVNEVYEFVGILSVDPSLSAIHDTNHDQVNGDCGHMEELKSRSPPASLVPRIHVVSMDKLSHNNPLLPNNVSSVPDPPSTTNDDLLNFIRKATLGDELAAQCILFHLLSRVYTRSGTMAVGKLSLNISGIPPNSPFPKLFADVIKQLVTKCCYLPMTLDNMNKLRFVPNKNYTKNKLEPGVLQLSDGSYLLLDETSLKPGSLDSSGVKNIRAISTLVTTQKVDYDFQFYQTPFYHDVNCVVLSEAKSMLPCDLHIKLTPGFPVPENLVEYFSSLLPPVEVLNKFRIYLTKGRMVEYDMEPHVMQEIENDFVSWRRDDRDNVSADDLHRLLVLARVQCASMGRNKLSSGDWGVVKKFDEKRKERMKT